MQLLQNINISCGRLLRLALLIVLVVVLGSCNTMRYVPRDGYLLTKNVVNIEADKKKKPLRDRMTPSDLLSYVQQRPNDKLLGVGLYLGMYNITDTSKHNGWHRFWREKVGEAPVIYDSLQTIHSKQMMQVYLDSRGYLNATVSDSVEYHKRKRKVTIHYRVQQDTPYVVSKVEYRIDDAFLKPIILEDSVASLLKAGMIYNRDLFDAERERVTSRLQDMGFWAFNKGYITYLADTSERDNSVVLTMQLRQRIAHVKPDGKQVLENHPIYRISNIMVNSDYDPTKSPEEMAQMTWDTTHYNGIDIAYQHKLRLRENILTDAIRLSPNELYDKSSVQMTNTNIRNLKYSARILFNDLPYDTLHPIEVTRASATGDMASTREQNLACVIQCTPNVRQDFNIDAEISTTSDYYSMALTLGYQNKNIFRGAENLTVNFRGAYELMKNQGNRNAYEFGVSVGLDIPRFLLPMSRDKLIRFPKQETNLALSYDIQRRPFYNRTVVGGKFGYSWSLRNGARFQINPVDINLVDVPWIDANFKESIENPYLANSYESQLIAGMSAGYYYNTNPNPKANGLSLRLLGDVNGNLLQGLTTLMGKSSTINDGKAGEEQFNKIFGIRFAQYSRLSFDMSQRVNLNATTQLAWRFFLGSGGAYGNSTVLPFERLYFAGGSNSLRGWQVRTIGPGGTPYQKETYPDQLGDFKLETNLEYRFSVVGDFGMAVFLDAGNIWMNAKGSAPEARFRLDSFYKQIAFNTGLGIRYNLGFVLLRLDWGIKLHNPNLQQSERWINKFDFNDTALHFAIGLPF